MISAGSTGVFPLIHFFGPGSRLPLFSPRFPSPRVRVPEFESLSFFFPAIHYLVPMAEGPKNAGLNKRAKWHGLESYETTTS